MPSSPRPNLQEVAQRAGVSAMTVSRALNGNAVIAKATRLRILQICQEIGYVAQPQVSSAMRFVRTRGRGHFNGTLGFLHSYPELDYKKSSPTYSAILEGAISRAAELGYSLDILHTIGKTREQLNRILINRGIRGVVVGMLPRSLGHLTLDWSDLAGVSLGYSLRRPALHRITSDLARGMQLICHNLRKLGYRRIAYVSTQEFERRTVYLFYSGFVGWHQLEAPQEIPRTFLFEGVDPKNPINRAVFWKWFKKTQLDCVISSPTSPAWQLLQEAGIHLPRNLGFATVDVEAVSESVSGLNQRQKDFGSAAVDKVVGLISTSSFGIPSSPIVSLLEGVWQNGPTTRKIAP